jgi:hypothetical protein
LIKIIAILLTIAKFSDEKAVEQSGNTIGKDKASSQV